MNYRGILIERDPVCAGWCYFDPVTRGQVASNELELLYAEIDHLLKNAPDGAD